MKVLALMISALMILIGAKALAATQTCQDTDLKKRVAYYASNLPGGHYAKWNEVSCASSPGSGALVFSIRHVVSEQHDDHGRLFMTIGRVERIVVDGNGNIDPNREAQWSQYKDGPRSIKDSETDCFSGGKSTAAAWASLRSLITLD